VHPSPEKAMSDGAQSLNFDEFNRLLDKLRRVADALEVTIQ
jgi:3-deoxy-D-arabinoheptulosonate-7-phosphate synthase (EC 2.5.1.54)